MSAAARREQLLDVTKAIVGEHGFHAVTIEGVAREAGITRPVVYGHFRDLGGLLEALVDREGQRAMRQLAAALPHDRSEGTPVELMISALSGVLAAAQGDPVTWRLVLMPPEGTPALLRERVLRSRERVLEQLTVLAAPGLGAGRESPDAELTARMISAIGEEAARLVLSDPERYPPDRLLDHARWLLSQLQRGGGTLARAAK
jgi:AcrR family transcriptional regulator